MRHNLPLLARVIALSCAAAVAGAQAPAPAAAPVPLPNVLVTLLTPTGKVKPEQAHLGALLGVLLEASALESNKVNVVTQGPQAEMLEDMGLALQSPVDDALAAKLATLSGASHVVFGTFAPAKGGAHQYTVMVHAAGQKKARKLANVTGQPAQALAQLAAALGKELGVTLPVPAVPADAKAQAGMVRCLTFAAVALERAGVKGRSVSVPAEVNTACGDAGAGGTGTPARGVFLATRLLAGDKAVLPETEKHVETRPEDRLPLLALVRDLFEGGNQNAALALLLTVQEDRPRDPDVSRMLGELHMEARQYAKAQDAFARAVGDAPQSPYLHYRLSYATYRAERPQQALEHARKALQLAGGQAPFYQLNLAERLIDAAELDEAAALLKSSIQQTPTRLTPRVRLGYVYLLQKNLDGALTELEAAEKLKATEREQHRGIPTLLLADLARAHALKNDAPGALQYLARLKAEGNLDTLDLDSWDFVNIKADPAFLKLRE